MISFRPFAFAALLAGASPVVATAQDTTGTNAGLFLELNTLKDVGGACRLSFLARNQTGSAIDEAVFETVIFDAKGGVMSLSLFDFRDLPADRPRVRQFDLSGTDCADVGQALINGANSCVVNGAESDLCQQSLSLSSRVDVELLG